MIGDDIRNPSSDGSSSPSSPSSPLPSGGVGRFFVKTCIVAVVISACTIFVADWVVGSVEASIARTVTSLRASMPIGGRQFWEKIVNELDAAASPATDLPPQKKQKIINDVHVIVARWRPVLDAVTTEMQKPAR
jgi:hypothetical protein